MIELCVTMTVGSAMMFLTVGMIHQAMHLNSASRERGRTARVMERLAGDLRTDTHRSKNCVVDDDQGVELSGPGVLSIRYVVSDDSIRREQRQNDRLLEIEEYDLPPGTSCQFELLQAPQRLSMTLRSAQSQASDEGRIDRRISPVLGRMVAFETGGLQP